MSDDLKDVNFSSDSFHVRLVLDFVFLKDLNGNFFTRDEMSAESYLSEGTLTERTSY